jgi:ankyrin repeat protein
MSRYWNDRLMASATHGFTAEVRLALRAGADLFTRNDYGSIALHECARRNFSETARVLLDEGKHAMEQMTAVDNMLDTPLHRSARYGFTVTAKILLDRGAPLEVKNYDGNTPLHVAAMSGRDDMVQALIARGSDLKSLNNASLTPRELALSFAQEHRTAALIERYELHHATLLAEVDEARRVRL